MFWTAAELLIAFFGMIAILAYVERAERNSALEKSPEFTKSKTKSMPKTKRQIS